MDERARHDTTETPEPEPAERQRPGSYYYDDGTGYELYEPDEAEEGVGEEPQN